MESTINYLIQDILEGFLRISEAYSAHRWNFDATGGRVIINLWIKPEIHNTGVNVLTLYGKNDANEEIPVFVMDTEGAFFYAYDGRHKKKLSHFESDKWYSICLSFNCNTKSYSLYIDGERALQGQATNVSFTNIHAVSVGSHGGVIYVKRLHVYANPVQDIASFSKNAKLYDAKELGIACDGTTVVTQQLQQLIDECSKEKGIL